MFKGRIFCYRIFSKIILKLSLLKNLYLHSNKSLSLNGGFLRKSLKYYKFEKAIWYLRCQTANVGTEFYSIYRNNQGLECFTNLVGWRMYRVQKCEDKLSIDLKTSGFASLFSK